MHHLRRQHAFRRIWSDHADIVSRIAFNSATIGIGSFSIYPLFQFGMVYRETIYFCFFFCIHLILYIAIKSRTLQGLKVEFIIPTKVVDIIEKDG
ncbi:hypothetical protein D3C72_1625680 [compost metagenome]